MENEVKTERRVYEGDRRQSQNGQSILAITAAALAEIQRLQGELDAQLEWRRAAIEEMFPVIPELESNHSLRLTIQSMVE